jgi:hypothetical protein
MTTIYLRFPDEIAAQSALSDYYSSDDGWITASFVHTLDPVGVIAEGGEWDMEGNEVVAPTVLPGWHVNFIGELPAAAVAYVITPVSPYRVFAE